MNERVWLMVEIMGGVNYKRQYARSRLDHRRRMCVYVCVGGAFNYSQQEIVHTEVEVIGRVCGRVGH